MHDDDHPDTETGRIYQSGIDPNPQRADYALPRGAAALDGGDPEYPIDPQPTRRSLLIAAAALGLGSSFIAGSLIFSGASIKSRESSDAMRRLPSPKGSDDEFLRSARRVAEGPIADLVFSIETFAIVFEAHGQDDPRLWHGIERLTEYAILDHSKAGVSIAERLLEAMQINPPPMRFRHLQFRLQSFVEASKR